MMPSQTMNKLTLRLKRSVFSNKKSAKVSTFRRKYMFGLHHKDNGDEMSRSGKINK